MDTPLSRDSVFARSGTPTLLGIGRLRFAGVSECEQHPWARGVWAEVITHAIVPDTSLTSGTR